MSSEAVTVVGGGIFGLSIACEIARRGCPVRVLEAARIGAGSSGGTVGALAPHAPEAWNAKKQAQLQSLLAAPGFWAAVEAAGGISPGYARIGRLQPVGDKAKAEARVAGALAHWPASVAMRIVEDGGSPLAGRGPWLLDTLSARLAPRRALAALAAAIRAQGGLIAAGVGAVAPDEVPAPAVWATGACGLARLSAELGRAVGGGVKGQSALLGFDARRSPQLFIDGLHVVPHDDGTVAVGSTSERSFSDAGPDAQLDAVIERARQLVPALAHAPVLDRWAGIRPRAASRAPLLGEWQGRAGHWVANGGFKIGFGMAPWVAAAMADLMLDGRDRIPAEWRL